MQRNPAEFVRFVSVNYHLLVAMAREEASFQTDSEIAAFICSHVEDQNSPTRKIHEMKQLGVLSQSTGEWTLPPFLVRFIDALHQRHVLATPAVVQAWVEQLQKLTRDLDRHLDAHSGVVETDSSTAEVQALLREMGDTVHVVSATIGDNIDRIAVEVAAYRAENDVRSMRLRLRRLIDLFEDYLTPIMRVLDTGGPFRAATQQIIVQCARLVARDAPARHRAWDDARRLRQQVTWLRRTVLRQADEANAELAPLCLAAARESAIARGVNRALETIRQGEWGTLSIEQHLPVLEDQDFNLAGDDALQTFMQDAFALKDQVSPMLSPDEPKELKLPWTPSAIRDRMIEERSLPDLLEWITMTCGGLDSPDEAVKLLHGLLDMDLDGVCSVGDSETYRFARVDLESHRWSWRWSNGS